MKLIFFRSFSLISLGRIIIIGFFTGLFVFYLTTFLPPPSGWLNPLPVLSLEIQDRHGLLLREVLSDEGGRCRWLELRDISPFLIKATMAAEDKNFPVHPGIDLLALARAIVQNVSHGKIISGGSTITQQLARQLRRRPRHLLSKLAEAWLALRLEHYLSKEEILEQYLNRIFYGNQAYGAEAASRLYFGKSCSELSLAEASFLATLPRSPNQLNPYHLPKNFKELKNNQKIILKRMTKLGFCTAQEAKKAFQEKIEILPAEKVFRAPHFCDWVLSQIPEDIKKRLKVIQTTLDYSLQAKIEALLRQHLHSLAFRNISNGAVVVLENRTGDILVMIGSKDFFEEKEGQVNGALSRRQPGSTLKPFTYAIALEKGLTPATLLSDWPTSFSAEGGAYIPLNYDREYHGLVRLRTALACSYNIPAVSLVNWLGPELLLRRLKELGFESLRQSSAYYGLGLTLGNGEVTLLELVRAYSVLARQGYYLPHRIIRNFSFKNGEKGNQDILLTKDGPFREEGHYNSSKPIFSPQIAYLITDILADSKARVPSFGHLTPLSFPFPVAVKTGTSEDFRDNWTVGYNPRYTVGVWVGNFNGEPMANVSGITGSGPIFHDIMLLLHSSPKDWLHFNVPAGLTQANICPQSGELATPFCPGAINEIFLEGTEPKYFCTIHQKNSQVAAYKNQTRLLPNSSENHFGFAKLIAPLSSSLSAKFLEPNLFKSENSSQKMAQDFKRQGSAGLAYPSSFVNSQLKPEDEPIIRLVFPQNGDIFKIDPVLPLEYQALKLQAIVNQRNLNIRKIEWYVNDSKIGESRSTLSFFWNLRPGNFSLKARLISDLIVAESKPVRIEVLPSSK